MKLLDNIENLAYGNINRDNLAYLTKESFFNDYIDIFDNKQYPNLKQTEKELDYLIKNQKEYMRKPNWSKYKAFCEACDDDIKKVIYNRLNEIGLRFTKEMSNTLEEVQELVGALVMHLKVHYQRARPYQVSYYTGQKLHPMHTISGSSPAYPSGHALQSRFLLKIVAFNFPQFKDEIKKLADDIAFTRIVMGVHYPSDNNFGFEIADKLATYPKIRDLYFSRRIF
jgi:hypothetical protein